MALTPGNPARRIALLLVLMLAALALLSVGGVGQECLPNDHLGCVGNSVYWFDSCDAQGGFYQSCWSTQECVNGACREKCGNGACDAGETCSSCVQDCSCSSTERCEYGACRPYCGNGQCNSGETCSSCAQDCGCSSYEQCTYSGCETYCGNSRCESDEGCSTCWSDCACASNEECVGSRCVSLCGNKRQDAGENCNTCPTDFPCENSYCYNGQCVQCLTNAHCEERDIYNGEFVCGPDNKKILEKGTKYTGICEYNTCKGREEPITKVKEDCGERFCQDGRCGCGEGFGACVASGKCERMRTQSANEACGCDFQCKSGYCTSSGTCLDAITVVLSSTKNTLSVGDELDVTVSADNTLNEDVNLNLALNIGNGLRMTGVASGMDCTGNQCKISKIISARGREDVTVTLLAEGASVADIGASVTYITTASGKERSISDTAPLSVTVMQCGDGICTSGESNQNCCGDCSCPADSGLSTYSCKRKDTACKRGLKTVVYLLIAFFVFALTLAYLFAAPAVRYVQERKKQLEDELRKDEQERHHKDEEKRRSQDERERVRHILDRIKDEIDPKKPPTVKTVIKRLKEHFDLDFPDEEIFSEEYFIFVDTLKDKVLAEEREKETLKNRKPSKFCTKCGYRMREGVKFCTVCGIKARYV